MSDFEQQIRRRLTGRAATVAPRTDLDDLVERIAKNRARGRRASAFAMALVVVVGPIAGFGLARATDNSGARSASARHASKTATSKGPTFSATPLPALKANGTSSGESLGAAIPPNGLLIAPGDQLSLGRMFARTSSDGIVLRVYGAGLPAQPVTVPWFTPAPWCSPNRVLQVDTSNDLVAGTSQGYLYEKPQSDLAASASFVGTSEGAPVWVAIVQSDEGTTARATFADGGSDSVALAGGVAVLAHAVAKPADLQTLQGQKLDVQILDASGAVAVETTVYGNGTPAFGNGNDPDPTACTAPAGLPAPGTEQPADVAAATASVTQAFADVLTGSSSVTVREAAIDDPHDLDDVYSKLLSGPFAQDVKTAVPHVRDVVFMSATQAAVEYDVSIPNYTDLNGQFGEAVFSGGRWKVTRETFCTQIGMAGVTCPP